MHDPEKVRGEYVETFADLHMNRAELERRRRAHEQLLDDGAYTDAQIADTHRRVSEQMDSAALESGLMLPLSEAAERAGVSEETIRSQAPQSIVLDGSLGELTFAHVVDELTGAQN